jgi:multiple sugar transport system substrate-binding protein
MKKQNLHSLSVAAIMTLSLAIVGCTNSYQSTPVVNDSSEDTDSSSSVDEDEITKIQNRYDAADYSYDGEECTLSMCHWDSSGAAVEKAVVDAVLEGFERRYPTIHVQLDILQNYESIYGNRLAAGNAHDVFLVPDGDFATWARSGKMMNLTPFISASSLVDTSAMNPSSITRYQYNAKTGLAGSGSQLCLPKDTGPFVMYYNKDMFDQMNVAYPADDSIMDIHDATTMWQNLTQKDDSGTIKKYGVAGLQVEGLVWSAGGDFLDSTRTAFPTDESMLQGLRDGYQYMQDAYLTTEVTPPSEFTAGYDAATLFSMQKVACFVGGRWQVTNFRNLSFNWDATYVPAFDTDPTKNCWSGSVGYAVNNDGEHTMAAWKLVEYIASKEGQEILASTGFQIPVYRDLALREDIVEREKSLGPDNYECFITSAYSQPYGLWDYRPSQLWKTNGYDVPSEFLFSSDPDSRLTVDEFLAKAKTEVTKYLS